MTIITQNSGRLDKPLPGEYKGDRKLTQLKAGTLKPAYQGKEFANYKEMINEIAVKFRNDDAFIVKIKNGKDVSYDHITFERFRNEVYAIGTGMIERGLSDKHIAVIGNNSYDWFRMHTTVLCGLGVTIPLDKGLPYEEIESSLSRSNADVLVFDESHKEYAEKLRKEGKTQVKNFICMQETEGFESIITILEEGKALLEKGDARFDEIEIDNLATTILLFTSGTTSLAKAVMLSQKNVMSNIYALSLTEDIRHGDVNMAFLPYHHTFGFVCQTFMLERGATTTFCDGLKYVQKNMVEYGVSVFVCVPLLIESLYKKINQTIEKEGKTKTVEMGTKICNILLKFGIDARRKVFKQVLDKLGGNLRYIVSGAAAIDPDTIIGLQKFGITAVQGYGMTEASPVISAENPFEARKGSIGKALPGIEVRIDEPNEEGIGELICKGPNVMSGYFENEEETEKTLVDGWLHTGDLARVDSDGYIYICGRKKNVIVLRNGKNIYPEELEVLIANLPYVEESMVFGEEKREGSGDHDLALAAKIVYKPDVIEETYGKISAEEIETIVRNDIHKINESVPTYKHINRLVVTDQPMIKTTTGKVKRYEEQKNL